MFLECYLDESENQDHSELVLAGFVSSIEAWASFAVDWKIALDEYGVSHFHTIDFKQPKRKLFRHLSDRQRDELFHSLLGAVRRYVRFGVLVSIRPKEYNAIVTKEFRSRFGTAYTTATVACLALANIMVKQTNLDCDSLSIVLESGHKHARQAVKALEHERELQEEDISFSQRRDDTEAANVIDWRTDCETRNSLPIGMVGTALKRHMSHCKPLTC